MPNGGNDHVLFKKYGCYLCVIYFDYKISVALICIIFRYKGNFHELTYDQKQVPTLPRKLTWNSIPKYAKVIFQVSCRAPYMNYDSTGRSAGLRDVINCHGDLEVLRI